MATHPLRMNAYFYSFEATGVDLVDRILSAVARAGKGFHHTEEWSDPFDGANDVPPFRGDSYIEWIQNAAIDAARAHESMLAALVEIEAAALRGYLTPELCADIVTKAIEKAGTPRDGDLNACPVCGNEKRGQGGYLSCECPAA